jgi:multidrug efflux pump subunit AcrB/outer membrane protein TolC
MNPAKFSLRYPAVALILTAMAVAVGIYGFLYMPRTEDPTITIRTGLVLALYPGATSEQVEKQVTRTLEKHIFKFAEVRKAKTFSTSRPGLTIINVELEDYVKNADVVWSKIRNEMIEVSAKKELPEGVLGPIVDSDFGDTVALLIAIHGKRYGYRELRDYLDTIEDQLRTIPEVGKLAAYGEQGEQIRITGNLDRMSQYFVDPRSIIQALRQRNIIKSSGHFDSAQAKIPLRTTGLFNSVDEIGNVLVKISPTTGQPLYIRDFAKVERRYQDPTFLTRYDGKPCLMLSVEMQRGKNIVELGENIRQVFSRLRTTLPPDVKIDLVANQPKVVKELITHLSREFMIAIISVVLITIILLPIRVAAIAALAIPITLSITLGFMNALGITLNQVSIAALIVVLGIVVDDAIVIADNYVDLLDRKFSRAEAAKRCVSEVILPVFAATATIIFSFLPLLILTGSAGEFIESLPKTASIALTVSFVVAIMITPIFCNFFIKSGLQDTQGQKESQSGQKFSVLNQIQSLYNGAIVFFMRYKLLALAAGVGALVAAAFLFHFVPQQFFPSAERNQFVIDVWMPQGSRIEATLAVMGRIEDSLKKTKGITHFASFVGQSAPRFYYNVDPQQPDGAYGQFIVDTTSEKQTPLLIEKLRKSLPVKSPEALVIVKELQQGMPLSAPVEVRIIGVNLRELKRLGARVKSMLVAVPYSLYVHSDTFNDSPLVDVRVNEELANRLGITSASLSALLAGGLDGLPVSTFWEGKRAVTMVLRLNHASRSSFGKVRNTYVYSPVTGASVPLRAVSSLKAQWQPSRIVRRNGVRTLTVQAFVKDGHYGSQLLSAVKSQIKRLPLPPGYRIEYGGEISNQNEVFPQMLLALGISIVAIFLTLLLQFRSISEALIIMASIPLALPGAVLGLIITHNAFGFTAFMGFISLCGIVVRNAIILVDYVNEKMREGHSLELAATQAGERRLRPIFLTTMAAAVGVLPMIFSGSSLWSPLASVIAIGLVCSMFMTLLVVPVLFVFVKSHMIKPSSVAAAAGALVAALLLLAVPAHAQTKNLSLPEAIDLAVKGNSALKIARFKIVEKQRKLSSIAANNLPQISNYSWYMGVSDSQFATIPVPGIGVIPIGALNEGKNTTSFFLNGTVLAQPVTQLLKIHEAAGIARSDQTAAEANEKQAQNDVIFGVEQLYYGLLVAQARKQAATAGLTAAQEGLREAKNGLLSRNLLEVGVTEAQTAVLKSRQLLLAANIQIQDFNAQLNELLGLPLDTRLVLSEPGPSTEPVKSRDYYLQLALLKNPQIRAAKAMAAKACGGVTAAREDYIPDVTLFAANVYQQGASLITNDEGMFGAMMSWNVWDWGKRNDVVGERGAQLAEAEENVHRLNREVTVNLDKAYRALDNQKSIIELAAEAVALQKERMRLVTNQLKTATISYAKYDKAVADFKKARSDDLEARLGYALAVAQLNRIAGTLAP